MNREQAERVEAELKERFPAAEVDVVRTSGGALRVEIHSPGSTTIAEIETERSAFLVALGVPAEG
jgi:hypothetical protein